MNLRFELKPTLARIFKKEIQEMGFDISSLNTDEDVLQSYCSYKFRLIENRPRTIHKADTFSCPDDVKAGLDWVESKINAGECLNPHLNSATVKDKLDGLLYDWGIHHLHLGTTFVRPGYVERTGPVLFAVFRPNDVYFVDIRDHEGWSDKNLLEIINRNWPDLLSLYKMDGVKPDMGFSEGDITVLRRSCINTFHELSDGHSYLSMGGGITTGGTSIESMRSYVELIRMLCSVEDEIKANAKTLVRNVSPKSQPFRDRSSFVFVCKRVGDRICFYDVVNNNY